MQVQDIQSLINKKRLKKAKKEKALNNLKFNKMKLYYHKTTGGAEYLMDTFIICPNGHLEGCINKDTKYIIRIDGDITKDAELSVRERVDIKYTLRDREAGNVIDSFATKMEAERALNDYETQDKRNGEYTPDFYEIKEN